MPAEWKQLDSQGTSWGLCEDDEVKVYARRLHDGTGWVVVKDGNVLPAPEIRYGSKQKAKAVAEAIWNSRIEE